MYRIHIMNESLHTLVHTLHRLVDSMLLDTLAPSQARERRLQIIIDLHIIKLAKVLCIQILQLLDLLDIALAHERSQIKIKSRNSLTTMHLVLHRLHTDTAQYRSRLNTLGRAALTMPRLKTIFQNLVQRVLHTRQRLRRVIILVVDMQIVVLDRLLDIITQQVVVHERLRRLARELHHHTRRRISIHISILASHIVVLDIDNLQKDITSLSLTSYSARAPILDIQLSHIRTRRTHQLVLHHILNLLHRHLALAAYTDTIRDFHNQITVLTLLRRQHRLTYRSTDLILIKADYTAIAFYYSLYHRI